MQINHLDMTLEAPPENPGASTLHFPVGNRPVFAGYPQAGCSEAAAISLQV
jgi:hypothetical protein